VAIGGDLGDDDGVALTSRGRVVYSVEMDNVVEK